MTIQEIVESIDYCLECDNDRIPTTQEDLWTIRKALEKQIPKKPISKEYSVLTPCPFCPWCDNAIINTRNDSWHKEKFCPICGQAIDWSDFEGETK